MTPKTADYLRGLKRGGRDARELADIVMLHLDGLDRALESRKDIPKELGGWLARWANSLDMANDAVRYRNGVDFRTDNKAKAVARVRARLKLSAASRVPQQERSE